MLGSTLGACLFLLVTAFLPGDVLSVVLVAGLVIAAGVFVVRVVALVVRHLRQPSPGRTTGEAAPRPGHPVLRPLSPADAGGPPTPLASAGSGRGWEAA
jgi:hypothetical protein